MISKEELKWAEKYWTSANYISAAEIYLKNNFLIEKKLKPDDIKDALLGHWGTCPGINFIYTHLNLIAKKNKREILLVTGPGHGFAAILANLYLEGSLKKYYPEMTHNKEGIGNVIKSFSWPEGFPSHTNPEIPGCIHEGGELGYALGTAFGAAFDNPELIVAVIVGDGEAETGPTATAWHSSKFINPAKDGAVLPILHLNGYKIGTPTIYGTMSNKELKSLFEGYGYEVRFVEGKHKEMYDAMNWAFEKIKFIQKKSRNNNKENNLIGIRWPLIILKTLKGWTGIKKFEGKEIEGTWRSHQVPLKDVKTNRKSLLAVEKWLKSYKPKELFPKGMLPQETLKFVPDEEYLIGNNKHSIGGKIRKALILPDARKYEIKFREKGTEFAGSTPTLGRYLKEVIELNEINKNFRIFSPDELESNRLGATLEATKRVYLWPHSKKDDTLSSEGRVMEILSEHTLQAWLQGYILTGRHGIFPSYEAFLPIIDSMISQYLKFIEMSQKPYWRLPVSSLNYLVSSVCWRQDHNGFSHQNPGFINMLLNKAKEEALVRIYLPADANMLLATIEHCLKSTNRVNAIVSDKQLIRQWLSYEEAIAQSKTGAAVWEFASDKNPEVVLASCGDYQTQEALATIKLLKENVPEIKIRFVNVSELNVLGNKPFYPNSLDEKTFNDLFTSDKHVIFTFHGYPGAVKQLLFDRPNTLRFHVYGYNERGTTTTPFDMLIRNGVSRYDLAIHLIKHAALVNPKVAEKSDLLISKFKRKLISHREYIIKNGRDPEEINGWKWK